MWISNKPRNKNHDRENEKKIKNISILYDYVPFMQIKYTTVVLEVENLLFCYI